MILTINSSLSYGILYSVDKEMILSKDSNINSCAIGYNVLSGVIEYKKQIISNGLPYNLTYIKTTRNHIIDPEKSLGVDSWSDNYDGFIEMYSGTYFTANKNIILINNFSIKLPGDLNRYYFKNGPTSFIDVGYPEPMVFEKDRSLYRIYASTEPPASSLPGSTWESGGSTSNNFGDIQFIPSANSMTVIKNGIEYTSTISKSVNGRVLFKFNKIKYPDGSVINLKYNNNLNLITVSDNKNNLLNLTRSGDQVSSVKFQSGVKGDYQQYDLTYQNVKAGDKDYLQLTEIKNRLNGRKESYKYTSIISLPHYEIAKNSNTNKPEEVSLRPILQSVQNHLGQDKQTWNVNHKNIMFDSLNYIKNYTTVIRSYLGGTSNVLDMTTTFEDQNGSSKRIISFSPDGIQTTSSIINILHPDFTAMSVDVTGYPCITTKGNPIKSVIYAPTLMQPTKITDQNNITTTYSFDDKNRILNIIEASGTSISRNISYIYTLLSNGAVNLFNIPNKITDGSLIIDNVINEKGQVVTETKKSTQSGSTPQTTIYTYFTDLNSPSNGLLRSIDGPRTGTLDKIEYNYDNYGNLATKSYKVNGINREEKYNGYNSHGQPEQIIQENGMAWQYMYNVDGSLHLMTFGESSTNNVVTGQNYSYIYNDLGRLIQSQSPDGGIKTFSYDSIGRLIQTIGEDGTIYTKSYYPNNSLKSNEIKDKTGYTLINSVYRSLDSNGRLEKIQLGIDNHSNATSFRYDPNGNLIKMILSSGIVESWTYDELNRMITHTDGNGDVNTKSYDTNDNLVTIRDALNIGSNVYSFRNVNILSQEYHPDFGPKKYSYNEADQLVESLYGNRKCTYQNIDEIGRHRNFNCIHATKNTDPILKLDDTYDFDTSRFGRLDRISSNSLYGVNTHYGYDIYDRVISKTQVNKALSNYGISPISLTNTYEWSLGNKLISQTLPSGRKLNLNYTSPQKTQLSSIILDNKTILSNITYSGNGYITEWRWGNGGNYSIAFNSSKSGAVQKITNTNNSGGITYSLSYGYDRDGRMNSLNRNNQLNDEYMYDNIGNLVSEKRKNGSTSIYSISYTYDKNRNRKSLRASGNHLQKASNVIYSYSGNKLVSLDKDSVSQPISYSDNSELYLGNLTANYDYAGRRRGEGQAGVMSRYMSYSAHNNRTLSAYTNDFVRTTIQFVYDENNNLLGEYTSSGVPIVEYIWLAKKPVAAIYGSGSLSKIYYVITDAQNTPRRLVDSDNENIVWSWDSTAFGVGKPSGSITFNLRFPGQYYDSSTDHFYNHNRYYNAELGRYMEPDPSGIAGGLNPYIYALNNPLMYVDSEGESPVLVAMAAGAAVGSVLYFGEVVGKSTVDMLNNGTSFSDNVSSNFSVVELGEQAALGAAFGGLGKAAFLARGVHSTQKAPKIYPQPGSPILTTMAIEAKDIGKNLIKSTISDKKREFTTRDGLLISGAVLGSKYLANEGVDRVNERYGFGGTGISERPSYYSPNVLFYMPFDPVDNVSAGDVYVNGEFAGRTVLITYTSGRWSSYGCKDKCKVIQKKE